MRLDHARSYPLRDHRVSIEGKVRPVMLVGAEGED